MPEIDHEPREKRPTWRIWWIAWGIVGLLWVATFFGRKPVDWENVLLGIGTGVLLCAWAITITGDKPSSLLRRERRN